MATVNEQALIEAQNRTFIQGLARLAAEKLGWKEAHGSGMYHEHWSCPTTTKVVEYNHRSRAWGVRAVATTRVVTIPLKMLLGMEMPASIKLP